MVVIFVKSLQKKLFQTQKFYTKDIKDALRKFWNAGISLYQSFDDDNDKELTKQSLEAGIFSRILDWFVSKIYLAANKLYQLIVKKDNKNNPLPLDKQNLFAKSCNWVCKKTKQTNKKVFARTQLNSFVEMLEQKQEDKALAGHSPV